MGKGEDEERIRKGNRGGKYYKSTLYACGDIIRKPLLMKNLIYIPNPPQETKQTNLNQNQNQNQKKP
jgi:hypothetical protein